MPHRLVRTAACGLLLGAAAQPAPAQSDAVVSGTFAHPSRPVYVAAMEALEEKGYVLRMRSLDRMLLTLPRFAKDPPPPRELAPQLRIDLVDLGDSTRLEVRANVVPGRPRELRGGEAERALAVALEAQVMVIGAITTALTEAPPPAADPREESAEYGYGRGDPIRVGGGLENGARQQRRYLDRLRGPGGEPVRYRRLGSCCPFPSPAGHEGTGALDAYEVTYDGLKRPVVLYVDLYTEPEGPIPPPDGFTVAPDAGMPGGT